MNKEFLKLYESLNELYEADENNNQTQSNISIPDVKKFYYNLKQGKIDYVSFHKAFDNVIKECNVEHIFDNYGELEDRGTYGTIKNVANRDLQIALKKLWAAEYVDHLEVPERKAREAQWKAQRAAEEEKKRLEKEATEKAEKEKLDKEFVKPFHEFLNKNFPIILAEIEADKSYTDKINKYFKTFGIRSLDELIEVEPWTLDQLYSHSKSYKPMYYFDLVYKLSKLNGSVKFDDIRYGTYDLKELTLDALRKRVHDNIINELSRVFERYYSNSSEAALKPLLSALSTKIDKSVNSLIDVVFQSNSSKEYYRIMSKTFYYDTYHGSIDKYILYRLDGTEWTELDLTDILSIYSKKLKVMVIREAAQRYSGRCYYHNIDYVYYNPNLDQNIGKLCGIAYKEIPAKYFDNSTTELPSEKIPDEIKALGLTKGERDSSELDSGD